LPLRYTMSMLTFFAALRYEMADASLFDLSVSLIIDDTEIVGADLRRTILDI
jgi:hypothetical protein